MNFTKVSLCMLIIVLSGLMVSCSKMSSSEQTDDTLSRIRQTGQIDACTIIDPPYVIKDAKTGGLSGIYIDAMNVIASKMNAKVTWHETTYGNGAADVASKRCDVVVANYFSNIPRAMSVAFTLPAWTYLGNSAIIRKGDTRFQNVKDIFEFDKPDITVAVATGEVGDIFVRENFTHAKVKRIDVESSDIARFCLEVSAKRADVSISDANTIALYAARHPEVTDLFHDHPFSLNPVGWAVRQDDIKWLHFIETALQFLETQGTLAQLEKKSNAHLIHLAKEYKLQ